MRALSSVAFLGPEGSYTSSALGQTYQAAKRLSCPSIAEVFQHVSAGTADWGFIPLENVIQGPVSETLDHLFRYRGSIRIEESSLATVDHCLAAVEQVPLQTIHTVISHEQALAQCADFLARTLPQVKTQSSASTASAAAYLANSGESGVAVLCSRNCLEYYGLKCLAENIAPTKHNKTRFALITQSVAISPVELPHPSLSYVTSVALDPGRDRQGILHEVLHIVSVANRCNLVSIHSRPDQRGGFVFYFDLEGHETESHIAAALQALEVYCRDVTGSTAALCRLGSYPFQRFHALPFSSVAIIGSEGRMGSWFTRFFESCGITVHGLDRGHTTRFKETIARADVVLLSVPMTEVNAVLELLAQCPLSGKLVIENASIKHASLPLLESTLPSDVELLGMHTMFGSSVDSLRGQNVVLTKLVRSGAKAQAFEDLLYKQGAQLSFLNTEEHDRVSAYIQALMHVTLVALADVLASEWNAPEDLQALSTPTARPVIESMQRVLSQSESLLKDMQTINPYNESLRHVFLSKVFESFFALDQGDTRAFLEQVAKGRAFFNLPPNS